MSLSDLHGVVLGHAVVVPVSDILALLSGQRRSGTLWVETGREGFLVQLHDGAVVYAQGDSPPRGQLLGEILVTEGYLGREVLERALRESAEAKQMLGAWLVGAGVISQQQLVRALAVQVQMIFDRMFGFPDARWRFEDRVRMVDTVDIRLNAIQLLLESARASDESHSHSDLKHDVPLGRLV